ncbi:glutamyl-tRNA reductase [Acidithiobacillus sp. CV18-2]|uniref:Glutamyl-tRNA reductase n=1 Tax=Igneacidithiobacillus copahuensis TaxID=2724909 RepID=A0AAE2YQB7_9PROT|nr:glutamyl-tRNA reductase [Igneacidithiobacillus copahuensis]MBU2753767.1 glutamyl-tRNA reductase [Acidithiobacillus sp. CV18-3]MBU2756535.1 glutamyl-tRNA reductase [Acidithiobacillus sp. BN09-2]MBU2776470.1 glutamyl-tRNA reductase [Acidithiobacillus sp. CV18-2]MBU2795192.1 glutamyl-tRNA reductase [Acidithiobacillus sp. VAN18-2]MBU2799180.1 glutamyl-tRNA reductase [Acidithiobacillus sp. VAN18-4]UTV82379.1 glutamyl-tRNA reductase [Acidithiobacillus sp. YTS05]
MRGYYQVPNVTDGTAIFCYGLSHHSAPIEVREKVAFAPEQLAAAHRDLLAQNLAREALIISTCNRTEIYTYGGSGPRESHLQHWLADFHGIDADLLTGNSFSFHDAAAVQHLFRVVCGLDSMIIGEPQILGQVKDAYQVAADSDSTGPVLNRLLHWAFRVAKQVRTETAIGAAPVSVAYAAVTLARQLLGSLQGKRVLLIGAGETIELVATHLREHDLDGFHVANRSPERARLLAKRLDGQAYPLEDAASLLPKVDLVLSCTASPQAILRSADVQPGLPRERGSLLFLDLAVPRDLDPAIDELDGCYLYTIDDLNDIAQAGMQARREAAAEAEQIIAQESDGFQQWRDSLEVVPAIRRLREHVEQARQVELQRFRHYLQQGQDPETVLEAFSRALMNKVLHDPISTLRQPCQDATSEALVASLDILFHLSDAEG